MLVSYQWLKEYVQLTDVTAKELGDKLSVTGIEVEGIENIASGLKKIVVGYVTECVDHPDSDHLHLCQVEVAPGEVTQIVCGAPNVAAGQKVIVALPGARIGDNIKIKKGKMRGQVSNGMICALQELGISDSVAPKEYADGIFVLPADAPVGADALAYLGLDDDIIELSITPNRADALSMHGVAYEVGAIYDVTPHFPAIHLTEKAAPAAEELQVTVEPTSGALEYHLRVIDNVQIAPSPLWLQMLLIKEGIRPINNVVDVTNYLLLEYGQPMHAFDYDGLKSKEILVRKAQAGETLVTLDGETRNLTGEDIVITNGSVPVALGGVMGGLDSEITEKTTKVVLEAALFDPKSVRLTSKRFNLRSESSARFEKGINNGTIVEALDRAASLIAELAGGTSYAGILTAAQLAKAEPQVAVTLSTINGYLGTNLTNEDVEKIFQQLGFPCLVAGETFTVTIPLRRWDIAIAADLVEEVARIYGYDNLPTTLPSGTTTAGTLTQNQRFVRSLRASLNGAGLLEAISYALTTPKKAQQFTLDNSNLTRLMWPMSEERSVLRLNLISGLLDDFAFNLARKNTNLAYYEIGRIFHQEGDSTKTLPEERNHLAVALTGELPSGNWQGAGSKVDFYTLKGLLERVLGTFGITDYRLEPTSALKDFHPGRSGVIYLGEEAAGVIGQIHPQVANDYEVTETYAFELDLATVFNHAEKIQYQVVTKFPAVKRDLALLLAEEVTNAEVQKVIFGNGGAYLKEVTVFDVYQGKGIAGGEKSLAYSLTFSNPEATMTEEQINSAFAKIQTALQEKLNATIR